MLVSVKDCTVISVWQENFTSKEDNREFQFQRALVSVPGEAPLQLKVTSDDYERLQSSIGKSGIAVLDIDARPGMRQSVYLKAFD